MRAFCKLHVPIKVDTKSQSDPASIILAKTSVTKVDFTVPTELKKPKKRANRFAPNPGKILFLSLFLPYFFTHSFNFSLFYSIYTYFSLCLLYSLMYR